MGRPEISDATIDTLMAQFRKALADQIAKKGRVGWVSSHETWGAVDEEFTEFKTAVHANNRHQAKHELTHVMIAALWGLASEAEGGWD